jgi:hypothetical protein
MSAMEMLCQSIGIIPGKLSREELLVMEAEILLRIYDGIKEVMRIENKEYFRLMKFNNDMENRMIEDNFIRCIIHDILETGEYSLSGIAYYTQTPEDVIYEIALGRNSSPSIMLSQKIIGIHRSVRQNLYREIIKKITTEFLTAA